MGRTWDAVIELFAARTIPIRTIERASGLILTEELSVGPEGAEWAECGRVSNLAYHADRAIYNVLVRGDSSTSGVKTTVRWVHTDSKGRSMECSTTHVWERALEAEVKARAEEQRPIRASSGEPTTPISELRATLAQDPDSSATQPGIQTTESAAASATPRSNAELLAEPDFRRAIQDLRALKFLATFQEPARDTLLVEISDYALSTNLAEYGLGRLFSIYYRMTNWSPRTVIFFSHQGQVLAAYRRSGLSIRQR
ncbi:MAG TPA: hypothetical protein VH763_07865 [Gemmatimonadales bacterium]|jgi:hypothetical protein